MAVLISGAVFSLLSLPIFSVMVYVYLFYANILIEVYSDCTVTSRPFTLHSVHSAIDTYACARPLPSAGHQDELRLSRRLLRKCCRKQLLQVHRGLPGTSYAMDHPGVDSQPQPPDPNASPRAQAMFSSAGVGCLIACIGCLGGFISAICASCGICKAQKKAKAESLTSPGTQMGAIQGQGVAVGQPMTVVAVAQPLYGQ